MGISRLDDFILRREWDMVEHVEISLFYTDELLRDLYYSIHFKLYLIIADSVINK